MLSMNKNDKETILKSLNDAIRFFDPDAENGVTVYVRVNGQLVRVRISTVREPE